MARDPHSGPVPERAREADRPARLRGRVEIFNATRPDGLDGWTMDAARYALLRDHILDMIDEHSAPDGSIALRTVVDAAQVRYGAHAFFPGGRLRNYCTFTKVDLEARGEVERLPGAGPQRIRRAAPGLVGEDVARRRGCGAPGRRRTPCGRGGTGPRRRGQRGRWRCRWRWRPWRQARGRHRHVRWTVTREAQWRTAGGSSW